MTSPHFMERQPLSTKGMVINSLLIGQLFASANVTSTEVKWPDIASNSYTIASNEASQLTAVSYSIKSAASTPQDHSLVEVVSEFYAKLENRQQPLGDEFEKVLLENLTALYET